MSNTQQRIVSAVVMLAIVVFAALLGQYGMIALVFFAGVLLVDELLTSMLKVPRNHFSYYASIASFIGGYIFFNFIDKFSYYEHLILNAGIWVSLLLMIYLFLEKMEAKFLIRIFRKNSYFVGLFVLCPVLCLSILMHGKDWIHSFILLLILNSSVDIGAWFFGKNFGKRKLWPTISPNKTMVGLFGGVISSVVLSGIYITFAFERLNFQVVIALLGLGFLAQIGDLIESKMKRQLEVKDSSNLIPGHGGLYDRVDSLIFIAPFYALMVRNIL